MIHTVEEERVESIDPALTLMVEARLFPNMTLAVAAQRIEDPVDEAKIGPTAT